MSMATVAGQLADSVPWASASWHVVKCEDWKSITVSFVSNCISVMWVNNVIAYICYWNSKLFVDNLKCRKIEAPSIKFIYNLSEVIYYIVVLE